MKSGLFLDIYPRRVSMDLESTLREIEPIFQGNHFTRPSFQEILAASQFANEMNSGRLSVKDAYYGIIVVRHYSCDLIRSHLRPVVHRMVDFLSEEKALELVELISEFEVESSEKWPWKFRSYHEGKIDDVVEDLVLCAEFIGKHRWADAEGHNRAKDIIDLLGKVYDECAPKLSIEELTPFGKRYYRSSYALHQAKSKYADKHLNARLKSMIVSSTILRSDPDMISEFSRSTVSDLGVDIPLEALLEGLCVYTDGGHLKLNGQIYLRTIFEVIKEGNFEKEHIKQFNDELAKWHSDDDFMEFYRSTLKEFTQDLKKSGIVLYELLDKKDVQFFNSGVYKPK